jgi:hypothetical protein
VTNAPARRGAAGVQAVAVDGGLLVQPDRAVIDHHLGREPASMGRDLGNRDERSHVDHLGAHEHEDGPTLAADLGQPHLAPSHSPDQASASCQNGSIVSGRRS